jgi:hypothetical protein
MFPPGKQNALRVEKVAIPPEAVVVDAPER